MMPEYTKSEADGWFYLTRNIGGCCSSFDDGSLGSGAGMDVIRFKSDEGRTYFLQARHYEHAANVAAHELDWLRTELAKAVKKRSVRKRILELLA